MATTSSTVANQARTSLLTPIRDDLLHACGDEIACELAGLVTRWYSKRSFLVRFDIGGDPGRVIYTRSAATGSAIRHAPSTGSQPDRRNVRHRYPRRLHPRPR